MSCKEEATVMKRLFRRKEKKSFNEQPVPVPVPVPAKLSAEKLPTGNPPQNCGGYPPAFVPRDIPRAQQAHFYVPTQDRQDLLACSLYCCPLSDGNTNDTKKNVDGIHDFDMDSSIPIIIICHGYMSWRNQMLLAHLAGGLTQQRYHTLRFDFAGNGHSTGNFCVANFQREFQNLQTIISLAQNQLQCKVACVVGHSKAVATVLRTAVEQETHTSERAWIPCFVNMSGRFSVPEQYDVAQRLSPEKAEELKRNGKIVLSHPPGGREIIMTLRDVEERKLLDSSIVKSIEHATVLTVHGSCDEMVEVENAHEFDKTVPNHELLIVEGADHNYNGLRHLEVLVNAVATFVDKHYNATT